MFEARVAQGTASVKRREAIRGSAAGASCLAHATKADETPYGGPGADNNWTVMLGPYAECPLAPTWRPYLLKKGYWPALPCRSLMQQNSELWNEKFLDETVLQKIADYAMSPGRIAGTAGRTGSTPEPCSPDRAGRRDSAEPVRYPDKKAALAA